MDNLEQLVTTLRSAASQQSADIKPAVQALTDNEDKFGFHFALLKVALSSGLNLETHVRWLAVLYLKNGIERHWRMHGPSPLTEEEKNSIRNEILSSFDEEVNQIALQFAVIVSKIARYDYPKNWPHLLHILLTAIESMQVLSTKQRDNTVLLTFRYVVKELSTKRLPNDRKLFSQISCSSYPCIFATFDRFHKTVVQMLSSSTGDSNTLLHAIEKLLHILKSLKCISPALDSTTNCNFINEVLTMLKTFLGLTTSHSFKDQLVLDKCHKVLLVYSKILLDTFVVEDNKVANFVPDIVNMCKQCIFLFAENRALFPERFVVNCMNVIKLLVGPNEGQKDCSVSMDDMQDLLKGLVFSFLPLTAADLENWEEDVEEFCSEEIGETWKYNLRPSAEVLFLTLLHRSPERFVPVILATLDTVNQNSQKDVLQDHQGVNSVLLNDAVFAAVGLAANELFDELDFEMWFLTYLSPYVQKCVTTPCGKILHRRVLWLIEQWMGVKPPNEARTAMYDFIISSMDSNLNMAVRLAASSALRQILDDFEFDLDTFAPFQEKCTDSLYKLLQDSQTGDSKMRVLHVLSFVIERLGSRVVSCAHKLAEILPAIWQVSEAHNMLRCAVLTTLTNVVVGLKEQSVSFHPFLINVIHTSTDTTSPAHIYLLADGLDLWITVLQNTTDLTDSLMQLFNNIYGLFEFSSESVRACIEIVESYVVLGGCSFISGIHGQKLSAAILSLVTDVRDECLLLVTRLLELTLQVAPAVVPEIFQQYVRDNIQHVLTDETTTILSTARMVLIARLALLNPSAFWNLLQRQTGQQIGNALMALTKIFNDRIDCVIETEPRKAVAMASLSILDQYAQSEPVRHSLPQIMCLCVQVLHDVCDESGSDTVLVTSNPEAPVVFNEWDNFHFMRVRTLLNAGPTHTVSLQTFVKQKLEILSDIHGGADNLQTMLTAVVDAQVLQELQNFL
ncbi:importin-11-like [Clavelina lepadiformis]|uniref:importin-11-like n=1 Tax=Clavelina lepadiformis TaxID=159417 RepID=UPI00404179D4